MAEDEEERIARALEAEAEAGRMRCARALDLARRFDVDPKEIGEACNRAGIKIVRCQLGCFR